ncbi:MAG: peptidoglycan DD-metalloendopeptidase family protein [Candidatus Omnitrophica bacterium]|nr:peptidoglycan DD-metalloendopeptidase family protein [Candidatus Omnitrophota bacterium]
MIFSWWRSISFLLTLLITGCTTISSSNKSNIRQPAGVQHTVKSGETLFRIALYYYETSSTSETLFAVERIKQANGLSSDVISPGQKLFVPGTSKKPPAYPLLPPAASVPPAKPPSISPPALSPEKPSFLKSQDFIWPVEGKVICRYGELGNKGIDILVKPGAAVIASQGGKISFSGQTSKYGETVIIEHPDGTYTVYGHDLQVKVTTGDVVKQGEIIARVKNGSQKIRYVHFEIRRKAETMDPLQVLPEIKENR